MNPYVVNIKRYDYLIASIGYFLIALFILNRILFSSPGTIGFFHDWPIGPYPEMNRSYANGGLYIWNSQIGNILFPTDWIFRLSLIPFSFLSGEILTKGILLLVITLSGFGAFCLGKQLKLSPFSSFAAGVLFIFSPIVFTRVIAGHIYYLIAYFLSPFIVALFLKGREEDKKNRQQEKNEVKYKNFKYFIIAGILTSFAAIQLQFLVMIFFVLLVFTVLDFGRIKKSAIGLIIVFSIASLVNLSPIILSDVLSNRSSLSHFNPTILLSFDEVTHASDLTKSLRLLGYELHPYSYTEIGTSDDNLIEYDVKRKTENKPNLVANPNFVLVGGSSSNSSSGSSNSSNSNNNTSQSKLPINWTDPSGNCNHIFKCTVIQSKGTTAAGLQNSTNSFQISTNKTSPNQKTWSWIYGKEINANPGEQYGVITHMKLNEFAILSHIGIAGYNETSKMWKEIIQCPSGANVQPEWHEYSCAITIPKDITKIRPILNAGWSSQPGKEAITLFGAMMVSKLDDASGVIPSWIFSLDFLIPITGFSALIFRKDKYTLSFAVISLIGLFLLKGPNPPLPNIFNFIFIHGFYIFREVWHVAFLYGFGISFLIVFFLERIITITSSFSKFGSYSIIYKHQRLQQHHNNFFHILASSSSFFFYYVHHKLNYYKIIVSSFLISLIVISNGYPLLLGNFGGYLQTYDFTKDYHTLYNNLLTNSTFNTLMLPSLGPIQYDGLKLSGLDPLSTYSSSNIFYQDYDGVSYPLLGTITWLHTVMQENKTSNLGKFLSGFGIKYVILRKDFVSNYPLFSTLGNYGPFLKRWYASLEPFLDAQKDLTVLSNTPHYKIYENSNNAKKFFIPLITTKGLYDYRSLLYISNFTSLSNIAVYPSAYGDKTHTKFDNSRDEKSTYDFEDLGKYATSYTAARGWTTNRDWFGYDYLLASRVHTGAFSTARNSTFSFDLSTPQKYENKPIEMWMRVLTWPNGKTVNISINGKLSRYSLFSLYPNFSFIKIFDGRSTDTLYHFTITNIVGSNYIEGIYMKEKSPRGDREDINNIFLIDTQNKPNLIANPNFVLVGGSSSNSSSGSSNSSNSNNNTSQSKLPINWTDPSGNCNHIFKCTVIQSKGTTAAGLQNSTNSFQISTNKTSPNQKTWSWIYGKEINANPGEQYGVITHMKLNEFAAGSHIKLEEYNTTSMKWNPFKTQCPSGTNGPLEWHEYSCVITIPNNVTKIRPILNAGWSSQPGKEAITLFSAIRASKLNDIHSLGNIDQNSIRKIDVNMSSPLIRNYTKSNPTLWHIDVDNNISKPFVLAFAEPYDHLWEASIYKNGKKVDVVNSSPLYAGINGFQINQKGNLHIVIKYGPQYWFETGLMISGATLACCLFYIIYYWARTRNKSVQKIKGVKKFGFNKSNKK